MQAPEGFVYPVCKNRAIPNMTISPKTLLIAALIHIYSVLVIANN